MRPAAYYNEIDPVAAQWLRNLIQAGHIAPGEVDERSILDVSPDDLAGYTQCHFFAGVGVWSYALRRAGWPDDREIWTGSCPCQPFSVAGVGSGFDDERHLWPFFHHLIGQRRPAAVTGEQVASKNADVWLDLVHTDLEALGYAFGAVAFPSAGVGAPHIRDRTYWVGNADVARLEGQRGGHQAAGRRIGTVRPVAAPGESVQLADTDNDGCGAHARAKFHDIEHNAEPRGGVRGLADADGRGWAEGRARTEGRVLDADGAPCGLADADDSRSTIGNARSSRTGDVAAPTMRLAPVGDGARHTAGPTNGFWRDADWLGCRDGKWRPVEPGTFPLAHGATNRVGRLRAYGNAINAEAATAFLEAVIPSLN